MTISRHLAATGLGAPERTMRLYTAKYTHTHSCTTKATERTNSSRVSLPHRYRIIWYIIYNFQLLHAYSLPFCFHCLYMLHPFLPPHRMLNTFFLLFFTFQARSIHTYVLISILFSIGNKSVIAEIEWHARGLRGSGNELANCETKTRGKEKNDTEIKRH